MAFTALTGYARMPPPEVMKAEVASYQLPALPEPGQAMCYVVRPNDPVRFVSFNAFVDHVTDSSKMGYIRSGQYIYFNLSPGHHWIYSEAENLAEIRVEVTTGDIIFIEQKVAESFMRRIKLIRAARLRG